MRQSPLTGPAVLEAAAKAKKLNANQTAQFAAGKLTAQYFELYHRVQLANTGSTPGVALFDLTVDPAYGLTNLDKGCKTPEDFIMVAVKSRVAVIADDADGLLTAVQIKTMSFDNLILDTGLTTKRIPDLISNSGFVLNVKDADISTFSAKNFFIQGNRKEYLDSSLDDAISLPDGLKILEKGDALKPKLLMPENIALSATAIGAGSKQYVWETIYIGYKLVKVA
jgi:hypothetical protein